MDFIQLLSGLMLVAFFAGVVIYAKGIKRLEATVDRMEAAMVVVAEQRDEQTAALKRMECEQGKVAADLAKAVKRADEADGGEGAAADAALRSAAE